MHEEVGEKYGLPVGKPFRIIVEVMITVKSDLGDIAIDDFVFLDQCK